MYTLYVGIISEDSEVSFHFDACIQITFDSTAASPFFQTLTAEHANAELTSTYPLGARGTKDLPKRGGKGSAPFGSRMSAPRLTMSDHVINTSGGTTRILQSPHPSAKPVRQAVTSRTTQPQMAFASTNSSQGASTLVSSSHGNRVSPPGEDFGRAQERLLSAGSSTYSIEEEKLQQLRNVRYLIRLIGLTHIYTFSCVWNI